MKEKEEEKITIRLCFAICEIFGARLYKGKKTVIPQLLLQVHSVEIAILHICSVRICHYSDMSKPLKPFFSCYLTDCCFCLCVVTIVLHLLNEVTICIEAVVCCT